MSLAVLIPAFNSARTLEQVLDAIRSCTRNPDQLIVIDDASTDATAEVALLGGAEVLRMPTNAGPAACRNAGAACTSAEILVFLDADTCVQPDTLAILERRLLDHAEFSAVIGSYAETTPQEGVVSQYRNLAHRFTHSTAARESLSFWSGCGAIRRIALFAVGGFDAAFRRPSVEDIELGYRVVDSGGRILLEPAACVVHLKRWSLRSAIRTDVRGRGIPWFRLLLARGRSTSHLNVSAGHRLSTAFVALGWVALLCALRQPWCLLPALMLFAAAAAVHFRLFAFLLERRGPLFLLAALPLFLLQQTCNLVSIAAGLTLQVLASSRTPRTSSVLTTVQASQESLAGLGAGLPQESEHSGGIRLAVPAQHHHGGARPPHESDAVEQP
jgi:glycosyltransferase involved in cell wall biosynthesis